MSDIFLHIGHSKTGSSSIQKYFHKRYNEYLAEGLLYPKTGRLKPNGIAQHKFAFYIKNEYPGWIPENKRNITQEIFKDLQFEIDHSNGNNILLSSEIFSSIDDLNQVHKLKKHLISHNVKVIAYLRYPDSWLESWYSQIVKNHPFLTETFSEFIQTQKFNIYAIIDNYAQVFGKENLMVFNYESIQKSHTNIISHLCQTLNIPFVEDEKFSNTNITPGRELIEVLRKVNEIVELPVEQHRKLNLMLVKEVASKINNQKGYLSDAERRELKMLYLNELKEKEYPVFKNRETEFVGEIK